MLFDRTRRWFATIHGSNIFAHHRATDSAVMQWLSGNNPACHTSGREFNLRMLHDFFSFLLNFSLFEAETDYRLSAYWLGLGSDRDRG